MNEADWSDEGQYWCRGLIAGRSVSTPSSSAAFLSVKALPTPTVTVTPDSAVFTGETVNLKCEIESNHSDWTYEWYQWNQMNYYSVLQLSDHHTVNRDTLTITGTTWSDGGWYTCKGHIRSVSTQLGSEFSLSVNGEYICKYCDIMRSTLLKYTNLLYIKPLPKSTVTVTPDNDVFTGETVNLKCEITPYYSSWRYEWYKDSTDSVSCLSHLCFVFSALPRSTLTVTPANPVFTGETVNLTCVITTYYSIWRYFWDKDDGVLHLSHRHSVNRDILTIRAAESDQGQYWCWGEIYGRSVSTQSSTAVYLIVKASPRSTVTVTPDSAVFTGETFNLKCVIESDHSDWTYEWYADRNRVKLQSDGHYTVNRDTLTIRGAAESDQGQYWCKGFIDGRSVSTQPTSVYLTVKDLKPKPELRSDPAGPALTGNTVTLTCNTDLSTGWDFYWYKNTQESEIKTTRTNSYSMKIDSLSDGGQYWCRAGRGEPVYYTQYSDELTLSVTESPKAVAIIQPDERVFRGETVTLRCDIKWGGNTEWTYRWEIEQTDHYNKYYNQYNQHKNNVSRCSAQELKISLVEVFHRGNYSCTGQMNTQISQRSDPVALTVYSDEAQAAVQVSPQPWLTEGHSVTLICEVPGSSTGWTFSWFRDADHLSDSSRGAGGSYTLSPAALQHTGFYTCRAERGEPAYSSQNSSAQPLWVTGVSASVRLVLRPSRSQHFSSDSLSLSCDSAGWTVRRYTHTNTQDCSAQTGSTCGIQSLSTSDTGVYWCESDSGEKRHPLNITVHDGAVILESSADPVIEGETLTLHCLHRSTNSSILTADLYKDGSLIPNQTTGEMNIPSFSKSDEGFYYCKTERGESPHSWISVRASTSLSLLVICVSVALSVFLLLLILLVLLLRHKEEKDPHCGVQQTLESNRSGEFQTQNSTLQSCSYHIYDDVSAFNNVEEEPVEDVTHSKKKMPIYEDFNTAVTYTEINVKGKKKTTGKGAEFADVLIEMKSKEIHGMSSESGDIIYSEVKHNADGVTMSGRGKGGKGLGEEGAKRHRKVLCDNTYPGNHLTRYSSSCSAWWCEANFGLDPRGDARCVKGVSGERDS
nr:sialoadhesin-like [Danio rerio]|eukprot:XP_021333780.1 sialoadhesin-like [Danio rerio]